MKCPAFWLLSFIVLPAQDIPVPSAATVDLFRDQLNRINANPVPGLTDAAARSRDALRAPLHADPNLSLAEIQAAQAALSRLNDRLNADAERTGIRGPREFVAIGNYEVGGRRRSDYGH